jgi:hypothetical protein
MDKESFLFILMGAEPGDDWEAAVKDLPKLSAAASAHHNFSRAADSAYVFIQHHHINVDSLSQKKKQTQHATLF